MYLDSTVFVHMFISLAKGHWRAYVNTEINLWVLKAQK